MYLYAIYCYAYIIMGMLVLLMSLLPFYIVSRCLNAVVWFYFMVYEGVARIPKNGQIRASYGKNYQLRPPPTTKCSEEKNTWFIFRMGHTHTQRTEHYIITNKSTFTISHAPTLTPLSCASSFSLGLRNHQLHRSVFLPFASFRTKMRSISSWHSHNIH